ncbi:MAG: STAS domain-containing protein [Chlamydiota bacterium]
MLQEPFTIEDFVRNERRILCLKGPLTISNLFDFQARVRSNNLSALILDLSGVPYMDSAGIGALVAAYVSYQKNGRSLALVGVGERLHNALKITQVESLFQLFDSLPAAEAAARTT